ncbi:LDH2 family (AllD) (PDB:1NXU) [Commensalibacter communis]|uniref:LDH2 family (AllD) n=1 Tax=Commensalibacter communis TaxID=2972786 RepID=A0A9W4TP54_9PROT|nr:Ldh family oxidoreductase [Commensalibacter communis]CAI3924964.1 LDH2 family (AllD) (PDB:1NXU) [Commensalibacter communis]CAI3925483.1 LDH2 family (AllD) (PDB:1NXU) [Commensalibacter communis]CAI3935845.1 LDH2 family (AllD) (PDB:1NXU) [Commensalibacter communis]CAI3937499.1 LDH2 family (AllD) (PDB:1NXU) [Commensalibacter communis]CAI3937587.1 LDH2 family (AllD) (PDB:1NXU) [Commensalibacter communis]
MSKKVNLSLDQVYDLSVQILSKYGLSDAHAKAIARVILAGERDECISHGVYRLGVLAHTIQQGHVSKTAEPKVTIDETSIVKVDAQYAFSPLAFEKGIEQLAIKTKQVGIAALQINHCYHFSALWPEVEAIAAHGLVGLAMTPSHAWVTPAGGNSPVLGTNPLAFSWPREHAENPYVFDFATSAIARGDLELHHRTNTDLPDNVALDKDGKVTKNAKAAIDGGSMLTFGGYKGSALSTMIELMSGSLIEDLTSQESLKLDDGNKCTPCHGELLFAFDPSKFGLGNISKSEASAEQLFKSIVDQGARLPSQRRFEARKRSQEKGVFVSEHIYADIQNLLK